MSVTDKATRNRAAPFEGLPFNAGGFSTQGATPVGIGTSGDIYRLSGADPINLLTSNLVPIRITQLEKGETVESYLTLSVTAADISGFSLRIGIGTFSDSVNLTADTSYTEEYIAASHRLVNGTDAKYIVSAGETLEIFELNLLRGMYNHNSDSFVNEAFVLLLAFDEIPDQTTGWSLNSFKVVCSAQIGIGV